MAVALKLMRTGRKGKPFYRIIVIDKRKKRNGRYIENLGTYDPLVDPAQIKLNQERMDYWKDKGAEISQGLSRLLRSRSKKTK